MNLSYNSVKYFFNIFLVWKLKYFDPKIEIRIKNIIDYLD